MAGGQLLTLCQALFEPFLQDSPAGRNRAIILHIIKVDREIERPENSWRNHIKQNYMMQKKVDVLINVFAKPYQTALSLLSLMRHSGHWIDRIWFVIDRPEGTAFTGRQFVLDMLPNIELYEPQESRWIKHADFSRIGEESYRHSLRYQYGWEKTDKDWVLIVHNDINIKGDVVGRLMDSIGEGVAAGQVGMCWVCPAHHHGLCSPERYLDYRPGLKEFLSIAAAPKGTVLTDVVNYMVCPELRRQPWPLPPCRVNEWCALVNMVKARPLTMPFGEVRPYGSYVFDGVLKEPLPGEEYLEFKNNLGIVYDIGVSWFRDMHRRGLSCTHVDISPLLDHWWGVKSRYDDALYRENELRARGILESDYGLEFSQ